MEKLPEVVSPRRVVGNLNKTAAEKSGLMQGTPVVSGAGDQFLTGDKKGGNVKKNKYDQIEEKVKDVPPGSGRLHWI
jgi:Sugar (pentulose and hexulose) kinases